jgi:hypothetical protein
MKLTGGTDNFTYSRVAEFNYPTCLHINQVIVLAALKRPFKLCYIFPELMFGYKITVEEELNGIIKGCPAHPVILVFHEDIKRFYIKVSGPRIDLIKNGIPFWCLTVTFSFKIFGEYLLYRFPGIVVNHILRFIVGAKIAISSD